MLEVKVDCNAPKEVFICISCATFIDFIDPLLDQRY